jgi:hypothetical protein
MEPASKPRRPWYRRLSFRISVRGLIVLVLVVGGGLGWIVHRARVQRDAYETIKAARADVRYDWEGSSSITIHQGPARSRWPSWLVSAIGIDYFQNVRDLSFTTIPQDNFHEVPTCNGNDILALIGGLGNLENVSIDTISSDRPGLENLRPLSRLKFLNLSISGQTKVDFSFLEGLSQLEDLQLYGPFISDETLAHLSKLKRLKTLWIRSESSITDAGLAHLQGLTRLEFIRINGSKITAAGLHHLRALEKMRSLWLENSKVEAIGPIRHWKNLDRLDLSGAPIDDEGLAGVSGFSKLSVLRLRGCEKIGDATLKRLKDLPALQTLDLDSSRVTDAGISDLATLPNLKSLSLEKTAVTDASVPIFLAIPKLQWLFVKGSAITCDGLEELDVIKPVIVTHGQFLLPPLPDSLP